ERARVGHGHDTPAAAIRLGGRRDSRVSRRTRRGTRAVRVGVSAHADRARRWQRLRGSTYRAHGSPVLADTASQARTAQLANTGTRRGVSCPVYERVEVVRVFHTRSACNRFETRV